MLLELDHRSIEWWIRKLLCNFDSHLGSYLGTYVFCCSKISSDQKHSRQESQELRRESVIYLLHIHMIQMNILLNQLF